MKSEFKPKGSGLLLVMLCKEYTRMLGHNDKSMSKLWPVQVKKSAAWIDVATHRHTTESAWLCDITIRVYRTRINMCDSKGLGNKICCTSKM